MKMKIDFFNTYVSETAPQIVTEVLNSGMLSEGEVTEAFEKKLIETFGFNHIVTLNSGTAALHLALELCNIGLGDEVIIPAQTFIATGLSVLYCKAKPVFADINYEDGNISIESIKEKITPRTKAVICVHWGGYPCDMAELKEICTEKNIFLIEDAAHALGSTYKDQTIGNISDVTCFSFQAIKHLSTGDGGAIAFNNSSMLNLALQKKWFGIDRKNSAVSELGERQYDLTTVGYKYHMNNYAAALGIANIEGYKTRLDKRVGLAAYYRSELNAMNGINLFENLLEKKSAYWLFGMHVERRLDFIRMLKAHGIPTSVVHQRIDRNSIFGGENEDLIQQKRFDESQIHIPIHDAITVEIAEYICHVIKKGW